MSQVPGPVGVLLVDKPAGITSHDAVARTRRALGTRKVGHAGTLDPAATGLLVLGVGSATRLLTYLVGLDKEYTATIRLGTATSTDDAEGEAVGRPASRVALDAVDDAVIAAQVAALTGRIAQVPSSVSAIKVGGARAYARVRAGETVELAAREVTVSAFEVLRVRRDHLDGLGDRDALGDRGVGTGTPGAIDLDVRVACSSGTYVRALARDLGGALGVGGHLTALRRTLVGPFDVRAAVPVDGLSAADLHDPAEVAAQLFPRLALDEPDARDLANGRRIRTTLADAPVAAAIRPDGGLLGLASVVAGEVRVLTNLPSEQARDPVRTPEVEA